MMPTLVTLNLAKQHLHIISDDLDLDIDSKLRLASAIVANHCKLTTIPNEWFVDPDSESDFEDSDLIMFSDTESSPPGSASVLVPGNVQAAILIVLGDLFENRESSAGNVLSQTVIDLLTPFRDPTMA